MRIVFIAPFGIRPKGTVIARMVPLARELQRFGQRVTIVAPPYTNPEDSGRTEAINGVQVRNIELGPSNKAIAALVLGMRLYRATMDEKPDVVHLFKPKGYGGVAAFFQILKGVAIRDMPPLFVDMDDWEGAGGMNEQIPYGRAERLVFSLQEKWLQRRALGVTAASRTLEDRALNMGIPRERVLYLPNCVDAAPEGKGDMVRERLGIPKEAPVLLLYTRFFEFEQRGLHQLFVEICRRVPGVRILVVGKGRKGEELELASAAEAHGFAPSLHLLGWIEPAAIPDHLAAADVAIYPFSDNLVNRSKCPAKLTEILRAGIPVVGSSVGQMAEYIKAGETGILCAPGDWQGMAERASELLHDRERSRQLGDRGRRHLLENFRWGEYSVKLAGFYEAIM
jgi:glycosyltransferase involved in cell wall biosynthesis